jgi:hypothetical protein
MWHKLIITFTLCQENVTKTCTFFFVIFQMAKSQTVLDVCYLLIYHVGLLLFESLAIDPSSLSLVDVRVIIIL